MITHPDRQADSRRPRPRRPSRVDHAHLVSRLTDRDRWILRMLYEHRVLTTNHLAELAFPTPKIARRRLGLLLHERLVDTFRPLQARGSAPNHWVLGTAGAEVLAAEAGITTKTLAYTHRNAIGIAHSLHLTHTLGVNEWFTALAATGQLHAWWSETRCRRLWGDLARPDGYGHYTHTTDNLQFFLEYDLGTTTLTTVAKKLFSYSELARSTAIITPILFWFPTTSRETTARHALHDTWTELPTPTSVPIATATAEHLDPTTDHPSPADRVWLPLETPSTGRVPLHHLAHTWPHLTSPTNTNSADSPASPTPLPPPPPTPPRDAEGR